MKNQTKIVKADGTAEVFDESKLENSLLRSGASMEAVEDILEHIRGELRDGMTTRDIYHHAFALLGKHNKPVAAKYSLRRAIMDLGPTGFAFEDLVAKIFESKGFTTETDKIVKGHCVEHEIDVFAYNDKELHLVEAKFHNQLGLKSDTHVALYMKARFDDLASEKFTAQEKTYRMAKGWLITNTKFTLNAIKYGQCAGLNMVGWNYPAKGNLQDLVVEAGLHPLTSISTLSHTQKELLLEKGIVLVRQLKDNPVFLDQLGLSKFDREETDAEIQAIL